MAFRFGEKWIGAECGWLAVLTSLHGAMACRAGSSSDRAELPDPSLGDAASDRDAWSEAGTPVEASIEDAVSPDSAVETVSDAAVSLASRVDLGQGQIATLVRAGGSHTCALLETGEVKCWGSAYAGRLGLGDGYDHRTRASELGDRLPPVDLGAPDGVLHLATGFAHNCAVLASSAASRVGSVKCWGHGGFSQLGLGDLSNRGDDPGEMGGSLPNVDLGEGVLALEVAAGGDHSCALLEEGGVKCWGTAQSGRLGNGATGAIGDEPGEMGEALPLVPLGAAPVRSLQAGGGHNCALFEGGTIKCWGSNLVGQLGQGDTEDRGDRPGELGESLLPVDLGSSEVPIAVATGGSHSCALFDSGSIKCWGGNRVGQLGLGDTEDRGDQPGEMGDELPPVDLGSEPAAALALGNNHSCALLASGTVKCWGIAHFGALGVPVENEDDHRGDEPGEMGASLPGISLPPDRIARQISLGARHGCALDQTGAVWCWGEGQSP